MTRDYNGDGFTANTHVIAVIRESELEEAEGAVPFRKYNNDSDARRRGTYEHTTAGACGC